MENRMTWQVQSIPHSRVKLDQLVLEGDLDEAMVDLVEDCKDM
jgi:hypothetical protein